MSFTRFHDDPLRIQKSLEESTYAGKYQLDCPGPGVLMPFTEDPHQRLQKWGANLHTNSVDLESDLKGITRNLNRDHIDRNNYQNSKQFTIPVIYSSEKPYTDESRASDPAFMYRSIEHPKWEEPFLDPRKKEIPFLNNISTRILEKDHFTYHNHNNM
jgi:hypothetical protein